VLKSQPIANLQNVRHKRRKTNDSGILLQKDKKNKNNIMKSQRTKQHICKPHKPTLDQSLQKSCFLADAPEDNCTFGILI